MRTTLFLQSITGGKATQVILLGLLLSGCATTERPDPLEAVNRKVFNFNGAVDDAVLAPVARAYVKAIPTPVRHSVGNFFSNPKDLGSAVNLLLQGRPIDAASDVARFGTNSTVGVLGLFDVAKSIGLPKHGEDFGQTFGRWGFTPGAYLVLPFLGPSSVREVTAMPFESALPSFGAVTMPLEVTHGRSTLLSATSTLNDVALDRYLLTRDVYLQRRQSRVLNGAEPQRVPKEAIAENEGEVGIQKLE